MKKALPLTHGSGVVIAAILSVWIFSSGAEATTCVDICGAGPGDCTITSNELIDPGSVLDCSGRNLTIGGASGQLKVQDGSFRLLANDLTINAGRFIIANENNDTSQVGFTIELTGNLNLLGGMKANNPTQGGSIHVEVDGYVNIPDNAVDGIEANGSAAGADGGEITLIVGGDATLHCPFMVDGNGSGETLGGQVYVRAGGDISTLHDGKFVATGHKSEGGVVELIAGGDVTIGAEVDVYGRGSDGDGGEFYVTAGGSLVVSDKISVRGGVNASGGASAGGTVHLEAGCGGVQINADIDAAGGEAGSGANGGALIIDSIGDVTIAGTVTISANSRANGGDGGDVLLRTEGTMSLQSGALIDASGDDASGGEGAGASVELVGCEVDVASGATVDVTGYHGGFVFVNARQAPPDVGSQPLVISEFADFKVTSDAQGDEGEIELAPIRTKLGECSNDDTIECTLDVDCTVGCQSGDCLYSNPDTDGVWDQFVGADPIYMDETSLSPCTSTCP